MGSAATAADVNAGLAANPTAADPTGLGGGPLPPTPTAAILKYVTAKAAATAVRGGGNGPAPAWIVVGTHAALCSGSGDDGGGLSPLVTAALPAPAADVVSAWLASPAATGDSGGVLSFPVLDGAAQDLVPTSLVVLPTRTSRHNCPAAPHVAAERLRGLLAEAAGGGRGRGGGGAEALPPAASGDDGSSFSECNGGADEAAPTAPRGAVVTIITTAAGVVPLGLAVARCLPLGGRKASIGASPAGTAATVRVALVPAAGVDVDSEDWVKATTLLPYLAAGVRRAGWWTDAPPNEFTTDAFVAEAAAVVDRLRAAGHDDGLTVEVKRAAALAAGGFGGLEGVGRAAADAGREPALVVLTYTPTPASTATATAGARVALVGKGIVFDTGGLSIKSRAGMCGMRGDCGGAAAVLAAFEAAVLGGVVRGGGDAPGAGVASLSAVLCIAENAVGPRALRPDDIISMYSGRTVMINNTDAEGRLVLGDGVAYAARDLRASTIIDIATLTGAQGIATGKRHAAVMASSAGLEAAAIAAGRTTGDLTHAVPYCPEFFLKEFSTPAAAMLNSVRDRSNAQVSCAGAFIGSHLPSGWIERGGGWLHVDCAAPAEGGTGYGVALLVELLRSYREELEK
ncbi:hypothetical protein MMPV_006421 [Pyropia vietnamensis]